MGECFCTQVLVFELIGEGHGDRNENHATSPAPDDPNVSLEGSRERAGTADSEDSHSKPVSQRGGSSLGKNYMSVIVRCKTKTIGGGMLQCL